MWAESPPPHLDVHHSSTAHACLLPSASPHWGAKSLCSPNPEQPREWASVSHPATFLLCCLAARAPGHCDAFTPLNPPSVSSPRAWVSWASSHPGKRMLAPHSPEEAQILEVKPFARGRKDPALNSRTSNFPNLTNLSCLQVSGQGGVGLAEELSHRLLGLLPMCTKGQSLAQLLPVTAS